MALGLFSLMVVLNILVVTRNRLVGLIDSLFSIKRLILLKTNVKIEVTIQDNSDDILSPLFLDYFKKYFVIRYFKTSQILSMSENWDLGLKHALSSNPNFISILADRRLVTANLLNAVQMIQHLDNPFICFDHQDVWLNSRSLLVRSHKYNCQVISRTLLLQAIGSAQVDWHFPMLFNCIIKSEFLIELKNKYHSFAEGSSPDMNFLARIVDSDISSHCLYDAPCIITNARHASTSNGSSTLRVGTIHKTEHTLLSGIEVFPKYMDNFVTANILGSLSRYWDDAQVLKVIHPTNFFTNCLLELSYPKSHLAFLEMVESLKLFSRDFTLSPILIDSLRHVQHTSSELQRYPMDISSDVLNSPDLNLLSKIER